MSIPKLVLSVFVLSAFPVPMMAQDVFDRTDPTQGEEEEVRQPEQAEGIPPSVAADPTSQAVALDGEYRVGAIIIEGRSALSVSDFVDILDSYSGHNLRSAQLDALVDAIASRARDRGYAFATAYIQPQALSAGVLRVHLDEGVIDEIRIEGADESAIRSQLAPLQNGRAVTLAMVERQILLAGDISGVHIRRSRYERENGRGILIVEASRSALDGYLELTNDGSQPIGPERARIDADLNGLILPSDEIDLTYTTTPFEPEELQYGNASYSVVVNSSGTEVGMVGSYSATEPGAYLSDRDVFGRAWRVGLEARHPLLRSRNASLWVEGELQLRDLRQEREGILVRHDRIPVIRAGLFTVAKVAGGRFRGRLTVSQGLSVLGATELGDPLASRDDASAVFSSLYAWADWTRDLPSDFSLRLAGRAQGSTDPLLSTEDLGLGGNSFLRGYNFSERFGDQGVMGSGELRYDWDDAAGLIDRLQLYTYADGGVVDNLANGRGNGSLASAGGGIRTDITRGLDFDIEVAVPLTGPRYDTDDMSPRFNVRIKKSL